MHLLQKKAAVKANAADFAEMDKQKAEAFDKQFPPKEKLKLPGQLE